MATPNETINVTFDMPLTFPTRGPYDYLLITADDDTVHKLEIQEVNGGYYLRVKQEAEA